MKITRIGYGYTQNLGNYENAKLYAEAEVTLDDGTDPAIASEKAYRELKDWIHDRMPDEDKIQDTAQQLFRLTAQITSAIGELRQLRTQWLGARELLAKHGIKADGEFPWTPPEFAEEGDERGRLSEHF